MKITFDGILIEDAKPKEIADIIKAVRGKGKISASKAGVYNLPEKIRSGRSSSHNAIDNAWTREELLFIIKNMHMRPKEMSENPALSNRGIPAISAKKSAIKSGKVGRMGRLAKQVLDSLGHTQNHEERPNIG